MAQASTAAAGGAWSRTTVERLRFTLVCALLFVCVIGGGASRWDVASLLYLRPAAVLCLAGLALAPGPWDFRAVRVPLLLLAIFAVIMLLQLMPLPPADDAPGA